MKVIVVLDNKNGMMFHNRRQSQDAILRNHILSMAKDSLLWITPYTKKQFEAVPEYVRVGENPCSSAKEGEYCFVEDVEVFSYENKIEEIILFRWNRTYPSDMKFQMDLSKWTLKETSEFQGKSHEKITKEVYVR